MDEPVGEVLPGAGTVRAAAIDLVRVIALANELPVPVVERGGSRVAGNVKVSEGTQPSWTMDCETLDRLNPLQFRPELFTVVGGPCGFPAPLARALEG